MVLTGTRLGDASVYDAAARFREVGMRSRQSVFAPPRPAWSLTAFQELEREFASEPDTSGGSFEAKLRSQLSRCSDDARLLMAELLTLHLLITNTIGKQAKLNTIGNALGTMKDPVPVPADLDRALENGFVNPGAYFNTGRPAQLRYLVRAGALLTSLSADELDQVLNDPWRFRESLKPFEEQGSAAQRQALLHLLFPATYEAIVSSEHRRRIVDHFAPVTGYEPTGDPDRDLIALRERLEPRYGEDFDFYSPRLRPLWEKGADPWTAVTRWASRILATEGFEESERTYKLKAVESFVELRHALENGGDITEPLRRLHRNSNANMVDFRAADDFLTWATEDPSRARNTILDLLEANDSVRDRVQRFADAISSRVGSPGNRTAQAAYLLMASDPFAFPMYRPEPFKSFLELVGANHRRPEGDRYAQAVQTCDELIAELKDRKRLQLRDRLDAQALIWALTKAQPEGQLLASWSNAERDEFFLWRDGPSGVPQVAPSSPPESETADPDVSPADSLAERLSAAAAKTHLSVPYLRGLCDLLLTSDKKQMVLYGPPGTGKTFVAQQLAYVISGAEPEIVQFHPSTTYEDFFEGIRPVATADGAIRYEVLPGPLAALATEADADRSRTHVLIIDELNRANLPKVLGELLFLFEYRDVGVRTLYRGDSKFRLPPNLYVIATMNTVDRSVALIDAAMRRRFHFVSFYPDDPELRDVLGSACSADEAWVVQLVKRVNVDLLKEFGSRDYLLGWSHFINIDRSEDGIARVWKHTIEPLIEDHLFGQPDRMSRFRWPSVYRRYVQGDATEEPGPAGDDDNQLDD